MGAESRAEDGAESGAETGCEMGDVMVVTIHKEWVVHATHDSCGA